jgi:polyketide synthase PksN
MLLRDKAVQHFKRLLSAIFKLPMDRIESNAPLDRYGIDSILVVELTSELEKTFGQLSKTLLFEYQTLDALVDYFLHHHPLRLTDLLQPRTAGAWAAQAKTVDQAGPAPSRLAMATHRRRRNRMGGTSMQPLQVHQSVGRADRAIAIIGVAGRYPQANNLTEFWDVLRTGKDCIIEVPPKRWDHSRYFDSDKSKPGTTYSKWGGFIDGVDEFDAQFFNISPREAEFTDPQERLFLQCVHGALEDAGYTRESLGQCSPKRNIGVYAGAFFEEYQLYGAQEQAKGIHLALSGSPSSIANRVSYYFNLRGPSMSVDSMCSGSLTALHLACESLHRGECDMAIAGGVNVTVHPNKYLLLAQGKFASSKGRCESFGEGGDGYVPAEGVGALVLKPLDQAVADGDQIHGVIRATAINHCGRTNGYTVPSPNAQSEVVGRALAESGIDPRTISYIEAHGTGTALGDPIEITGLSKAFGAFTQDKQFCAIGSVKSNIGHAESAAGIAGVTKVLLQMRHGQLVPSLHSQVLNSNIDFTATPFVVQRELAEWKRPVLNINGQAMEFPRRAGVSSFGAGGSNAHVVIEEYVAAPIKRMDTDLPASPVLVVLSARNAERLQERGQQLLSTISNEGWGDDRLLDLAFTLQVGREAMDERLAMQVQSMSELKEKLSAHLSGLDGGSDLYRGQVKRNMDVLATFTADDDLAAAVDAWVAKGKLRKLLDLWVKGMPFDWNKLYRETKPQRISLPTYPFARERYWVPQLQAPSSAHSWGPQQLLHPLVQRNTSRLKEQRYSAIWSGEEFFLSDHVVQGRKVLPGVAYLEMAREALMQAEAFAEHAMGVRLRDVVWARPVVINDTPVEVHIGLHEQDDGRIGYEVYSAEGDVHSRGTAEVLKQELQRVDVPEALAACNRAMLQGDVCYAEFASLGLGYGPAFQAIECIHVGDGMAMARLQLPDVVAKSDSDYVLHPSLLDAGLQAIAGLTSEDQRGQLALPFAVAEVEIVGRCSARMWALVKPSEGATGQDRVRKYDITLCDDEGVVAVKLKGFASRVVDGQLGASSVLLLAPQWQPQVADGVMADYHERHIVLCGVGVDAADLMHGLGSTNCVEVPLVGELVSDYSHAVQSVCSLVQDILQRKPSGPVLLQVLVAAGGEHQLLAGLTGLLRTARQEQPKLMCQLMMAEQS